MTISERILMVFKRCLPWLLVFFCPTSFANTLDEDVHRLLKVIEQSSCEFVRNGKSHSASESVHHIRRKYAHFEDKIDSLDRFIELSATKSLITGRAYTVRCGDTTLTSADWLQQQATRLGLNS